jgi:hypothetical protein
MPFALRITGTLPALLIEQALAEIVTRHEVLRTTYTEQNEQPIQVIHDAVSFILGLGIYTTWMKCNARITLRRHKKWKLLAPLIWVKIRC